MTKKMHFALALTAILVVGASSVSLALTGHPDEASHVVVGSGVCWVVVVFFRYMAS